MAKLRKLVAVKTLLTVAAVLVATALPVFVGYVKISNTYDDFQSEVFSSAWTYLFLLALVMITWAVIGLLGFLVGPNWWGPFAIVVAAVVGVLLANPLSIAPLRGADAPGNPERYRLVNLTGALEQLLTDRLDDRVRETQASETDTFVDEWLGRGKRGKAALVRRVRLSLSAPDDDLSRAQRDRVQAKVKAILATRKVRYETRLRRVARALYEAGLRDTVAQLAR